MATDIKKIRDLEFYLSLPWTTVLIPDESGGFGVKIDELPGCISQGETVSEAYGMIRDALRSWLTVALENGIDIPEPGQEHSGKFLVRVPKTVHRELARRARLEGVSLNLYVASVLAKAVGEHS